MTNTETFENNPVDETNVASNDTTPIADNKISDSDLKVAVENSGEVPVEKSEAIPHESADSNKENFDEVFNELKGIKDANGSINIKILNRIKGGYKATYKDMPVFMPYSQFTLSKSLDEETLNSSVGKEYLAKVYELQEDETKRKTVVVTRKAILENEFWDKIHVGDIIEGPVSSVASFGIFIDLGGNEGLIHISRLSRKRVEDTKQYAKKGDVLKAKVVDIDREKNRIALSRKELEENPWTGMAEKYPVGTRVKAVVKRIVDFGSYLEVEPGIDALLRNGELSWTKRYKNSAEIIKPDQQIEVAIINVNEEKQTMGVSLKETTENPWAAIAENYAISSQHNGIIKEISAQGCVITLNNEVDGFMPRSKMKEFVKGKKVPYTIDQEIKVSVLDVDPTKESLILTPVVSDEEKEYAPAPRRESRPQRFKEKHEEQTSVSSGGAVTLGDLLSEKMKQSLLQN